MTGGRVLKLKKYLRNYNRILVTYGDGLANVNLNKLIKFHKKKRGLATVTAVKPFSNFGELFLSKNDRVKRMSEKEHLDNRWINGGFFIFEKSIFNFIKKKTRSSRKTTAWEIIEKGKSFCLQTFWVLEMFR